MKTKYILIIIVAFVVVPIVINYICLSTVPSPVIGDGVTWLSFFGSYLGGVITALITLYILYKTMKTDKYKKEYEIQKEFYYRFCDDLGELSKVMEYEEIPFILQSLKYTDAQGLATIKTRIREIDLQMKSHCNAFILKYEDEESITMCEYICVCKQFTNKMRDYITDIFATIDKIESKRSSNPHYHVVGDSVEMEIINVSNKCKEEFEQFSSDKIFDLADKCKKNEWAKVEELKKKYKEA